jgi:hypothetical protein
MIFKTALFVILVTIFASTTAFADGCYICKDGSYVKYQGEDTFPLRHKAQEQFGCEVSGTISFCSNEKGTVGKLEITRQSQKLAINNKPDGNLMKGD